MYTSYCQSIRVFCPCVKCFIFVCDDFFAWQYIRNFCPYMCVFCPCMRDFCPCMRDLYPCMHVFCQCIFVYEHKWKSARAQLPSKSPPPWNIGSYCLGRDGCSSGTFSLGTFLHIQCIRNKLFFYSRCRESTIFSYSLSLFVIGVRVHF